MAQAHSVAGALVASAAATSAPSAPAEAGAALTQLHLGSYLEASPLSVSTMGMPKSGLGAAFLHGSAASGAADDAPHGCF